MSERSTLFSVDQVGTGTVRFPSGAPIPTASDIAVDPYIKTRQSKDVHVEGIMFWPQAKQTFPGIVLLHEWWGLNSQIKDTANRLASEGFVVLVPNLFGRQGGMVTANTEVAEALMSRIKENDLMQDINSCCEFLNTRDHVRRNIHGVIGFGMGGTLAMRFACQRRRLRAAVSFYGRMFAQAEMLKDLHCPLLCHYGADDDSIQPRDVELLQDAAAQTGKKIEIRSYEGAGHAFCNENQKDSYRPTAAQQAWDVSIEFLNDSFRGL